MQSFDFLTKDLKVPESFLEDIADVDERPRTDTEEERRLASVSKSIESTITMSGLYPLSFLYSEMPFLMSSVETWALKRG